MGAMIDSLDTLDDASGYAWEPTSISSLPPTAASDHCQHAAAPQDVCNIPASFGRFALRKLVTGWCMILWYTCIYVYSICNHLFTCIYVYSICNHLFIYFYLPFGYWTQPWKFTLLIGKSWQIIRPSLWESNSAGAAIQRDATAAIRGWCCLRRARR